MNVRLNYRSGGKNNLPRLFSFQMFDVEVYLIKKYKARKIIFAFTIHSVLKREQHFFYSVRRRFIFSGQRA